MSKESLGLLIRKLRKEKGFSYRGLEKEMKMKKDIEEWYDNHDGLHENAL